ncbi:MAG: mechanosensitive ion channel [Holophaga sp.]|nr:mechanosensitive ion channel [Holophaga sp.]
MNKRHWFTGIILTLLLGSILLGLRWMKEPAQAPEAAVATPGTQAKDGKKPRQRQVDQRALLMARRLGPLALTIEEKQFARQAERLANHEVDLAFSEAIRQAIENPAPLSAEAKQLKDLRDQAASALEADRTAALRLNRQLKEAGDKNRTSLEDQMELVKAQTELHQGELEEAQEDLERAGGDPQAQIRRLKESLEAAERDSKMSTVEPDGGSLPPHSMLAKLRLWNAQRKKLFLLGQAQQEAQTKVQRLSDRKDALTKAMATTKDTREATKQWAEGLVSGNRTDASSLEAESAAAEMRKITADQQRLTGFAKRIQDQRGLVDVYGQWATTVQAHYRAALRTVMVGLAVFLGILLGAFLLNRLIDRLYFPSEVKLHQRAAAHTVARFAIQFLAAVTILFLFVGLPSQTTTILGLAGAGLTVALKDFIVAFFGWFILMGRNGIRVGDWVEIKGVGGQVVEIGPLRTVLLETGSWNDAGHPTGRRVAFVNSFAMEGHFFNFTTSGKWMWDELKVMVQPGQDPYPLLEHIQTLVSQVTEKNAAEAEKEWHRSTNRYRVKAFTATPGIQILTTSLGLEIRARYITRANERHENRKQLNESVIALLHGKRGEPNLQA